MPKVTLPSAEWDLIVALLEEYGGPYIAPTVGDINRQLDKQEN